MNEGTVGPCELCGSDDCTTCYGHGSLTPTIAAPPPAVLDTDQSMRWRVARLQSAELSPRYLLAQGSPVRVTMTRRQLLAKIHDLRSSLPDAVPMTPERVADWLTTCSDFELRVLIHLLWSFGAKASQKTLPSDR